VTERYGSARLTSSWPRAAWYLAEQGRWGLKQVSRLVEFCRVLRNLSMQSSLPVGFVTQAGPSP
jgi:hypothetical protein